MKKMMEVVYVDATVDEFDDDVSRERREQTKQTGMNCSISTIEG